MIAVEMQSATETVSRLADAGRHEALPKEGGEDALESRELPACRLRRIDVEHIRSLAHADDIPAFWESLASLNVSTVDAGRSANSPPSPFCSPPAGPAYWCKATTTHSAS